MRGLVAVGHARRSPNRAVEAVNREVKYVVFGWEKALCSDTVSVMRKAIDSECLYPILEVYNLIQFRGRLGPDNRHR